VSDNVGKRFEPDVYIHTWMSYWWYFRLLDRVVYSVCTDVSVEHAACLCLQPNKKVGSKFLRNVVTNEVYYTMPKPERRLSLHSTLHSTLHNTSGSCDRASLT